MTTSVVSRAAPLLPYRILDQQLRTRERQRRRVVRSRGPRAPLIRQDFSTPQYCRTTWPGGIMGFRKGVTPDPKQWARVGRAGIPTARCYPNNMAAVADLVSNGTYSSGFRFGADGSAATERARQDILKAQRFEATGVWTSDRAAAEIGAALQASMSDPRTAARGRVTNPAAATARRLQADTGAGRKPTLTDDDLSGVCGLGDAKGDWYCKLAWPYGWIRVPPEKAKALPEYWLKIPTGPEGEITCPPGVSWWLRAGAWIVRETYEGLNETGEGVKQVTRQVTRYVQRNLAEISIPTAQLVGAIVGTGPVAAVGEPYCKKIWPGGFITVQAGDPIPDPAIWAPVSAGKCFPGV